MKLMENGAASNMAEARVRIYRQDHVLKEQKTKSSNNSQQMQNQDLRSQSKTKLTMFNTGPLRPDKTNDGLCFIGPKVDIMVLKGRCHDSKVVNSKTIESHDSDQQLIQVPLIAISQTYLPKFQQNSEAYKQARSFCEDSKWNKNFGTEEDDEAGRKSFFHHAVDTISLAASNMLSKRTRSQYDNPFLYLQTWSDLIDELMRRNESDTWRNHQRETNDYAENCSLIERIKKIAGVIDRPTESAEDSMKKYLELSMKQNSDSIIDYRDRFIYTIMFGFDLKRSEFNKIENYRASRIQRQFIHGITDNNFGNYFAKSLNPYTITTVENIKFVPMNAFLEALMSAKAVFGNMNFTVNKAAATVHSENNDDSDEDTESESNVTRHTHNDSTLDMICRGCNVYTDCTTDDCEFLDLLEGKDSRIQTILNRNLTEEEKNEEIDRIDHNYNRILNKVIRKHRHDPSGKHIFAPQNAEDNNHHEYNSHVSYDDDDKNYDKHNSDDYHSDNQNDDDNDYHSTVENDTKYSENDWEDSDGYEHHENHTIENQNDIEPYDRVVRFTNTNENVNRTVNIN